MIKKISFILCSYNEKKFVDRSLSNLLDIYPNMEVIIKDQDSSDGTADYIREKYPWVILIEGKNEGLSKGYNTAVKRSSGDYLFFLGLDAYPTRESIFFLVDYMNKNPEVGMSTLKLLLEDGSIDIDCHRAFPTPWNSLMKFSGLGKCFPKSKFFNGFFLPGKDLSKPHEIDHCISHFMFCRREAFESIGGFDDEFFLWGEDIDFCYRLKVINKWKIMFLPQYTCLHLKGGSIGIRKTTRDLEEKPLDHRLKMQKLSTEAMSLFMKKHYMNKYPKVILYPMFWATEIMGKLRIYLESKK